MVYALAVKIHQEHLEIRTAGKGFVNVTERLHAVVAASGVRTGLLTVFVCHTSASLVIQENADPAVLRDLERYFAELVPEARRWEHDDEGPDDMPAHVRSALTRTSESIPVHRARLVLGTWQGVYLWEHRARAHDRRLVAHVMGTGQEAAVFDLRVGTSQTWLEVVFADFDQFMLDHTLCERKASAMGMSLVAKYPDRGLIVDDLIAFAREELEHFHIMYRLIKERGLVLPADERDEYVNELRRLMHGRREEQLFLDRLLVPGIVEARGCERLHLVSEALEPGTLKDTYLEVTRAEARHHALFFRLAKRYFSDSVVEERAAQLLDAEAEIVSRLPVRARVH